MIRLGRLDEESTCNFGMIQGGVATNIIPESVDLTRVRCAAIPARNWRAIPKRSLLPFKKWSPTGKAGRQPATPVLRSTIDIVDDYPPLAIAEDAPVLQRIKKAAGACRKELRYIVAGGGSDANIFNGFGLPTAIVATGMRQGSYRRRTARSQRSCQSHRAALCPGHGVEN